MDGWKGRMKQYIATNKAHGAQSVHEHVVDVVIVPGREWIERGEVGLKESGGKREGAGREGKQG